MYLLFPSLVRRPKIFFHLGLSRPLFGFLFFHCLCYNWQIFDDGDRQTGKKKNKKEYAPFFSLLFRKSPEPSKNRFTAILNQKRQVRTRIRTRHAWTECHCSTAWATTTARDDPRLWHLQVLINVMLMYVVYIENNKMVQIIASDIPT